jgi:hypothetical protein
VNVVENWVAVNDVELGTPLHYLDVRIEVTIHLIHQIPLGQVRPGFTFLDTLDENHDISKASPRTNGHLPPLSVTLAADFYVFCDQ